MKKAFLFICAVLFIQQSKAQLAGNVSDSLTGEKITGAVVTIENSFYTTTTDADGNFSFPKFKAGRFILRVAHLSYISQRLEIDIPGNSATILLSPKSYLANEVAVIATRASDNTPTAFTKLTNAEIEKRNLGQDIPFLLNTTPSAVATSDAGTGIGYTGIRIRGSDAARVNVTINGIPVNDAEENLVYWVDLPDLASSIENIQVQRGVGSSTNGSGAFGASINILTTGMTDEQYASAASSYGSFNTFKNTLRFGTGLLKNKFSMEGRFSKITSDGFVDRATADLKSFFLSAGYYGRKTTLRLLGFSGIEKTYQAWNGVPEAKLRDNADDLITHYYNNLGYLYNNPEDSVNLFSSDARTYNVFTYKNQTDNYQQDYYQLHYSFAATKRLTLNAALHYTKGKGYYEEYKYNQLRSDYGLNDLIIGADTLMSNDLIRQKWLDNDFYGFTFSSEYENEKTSFVFGAASNFYSGAHPDRIIWSQYAASTAKDYVYENDDADKSDFNAFVKLLHSTTRRLYLFADVQIRQVSYTFTGYNESLERARQTVTSLFINPKAGITYELNRKSKAYASVAVGNKEPVRKDYVETTSSSRPKPEHLTDVEAGYKFSSAKFRFGLNGYAMMYQDQLILTGKINDVGEYTRTNVPESSRMGLELEAAFDVTKSFSISGNLTCSRNKVENFIEYTDDYDAGGQQEKKFDETDIAFSPPIISSLTISWLPVKNFSVALYSKYVGSQYLDNTGNNDRKLDAYFVNDLLLQYRLLPKFCREITIKLAVNNLLNAAYESNGYTYGYIYGGERVQENFYFPQAGINWMGGIAIRF